jgi:hypothetical protein
MKTLVLLLFSISTLFISNPILEEYHAVGGNERESLKLYEGGNYSYNYWMHLGYFLKDTGTYIKNDTLLILISLSSKTGNTSSSSRRKYTSREELKRFNNDTLIVKENKILISDKGGYRNKNDSIRIRQRALYKRK